MSLAREARCLLRAGRHAVLSTLSQALPGYPFGSVVPYVLDAQAHPVVLVSRLAEHTRNIGADPRVSLIVLAAGGEVQENARVTYLGRALRLDPPGAVEGRYLRFFPAAREYRSQFDFDFFRIEPVSLRVIAGFAKAHWLSREAYAPPAGDLAAQEEAVVAHLNSLDAQALRALCGGHGKNSQQNEIIGVDCDGFDVRADGDILRFDFERCIPGADEARAAAAGMIRSPRRH
jgi:putative heme iron utilization protein